MKSNILKLAAAATLLASTAACGSMGSLPTFGSGATSTQTTTQTTTQSTGATTGDYLTGLLSNLVGSAVPLNKQTLVGTWNYQKPAVRFESENALMQAGGMVGATTVENKLEGIYSTLGISQGKCSFTFNEDGTCYIQLGRIPISGTWTLDSSSRQLAIVGQTGLLTLNATAYYDLKGLTLLFEADRLLTAVKAVAQFTGKSSTTVGTLSELLNQFDGMQLGFYLTK